MTNLKIYLNVPYAAKILGAKWGPAKKKWYAPADKKISLFFKWHSPSNSEISSVKTMKLGGGVITYAKDKNFVAYSGELPPWD